MHSGHCFAHGVEFGFYVRPDLDRRIVVNRALRLERALRKGRKSAGLHFGTT